MHSIQARVRHTADFINLVQFNQVDWSGTKAALEAACQALPSEDTSPTGKWARAYVLHATGHPEDAAEADELIKALTADRPSLRSWRLVERYCATDPCDPASQTPPNLEETVSRYRTIDVNKLRSALGPTEEDHFFAMARPALARFSPQVAVSAHRDFGRSIPHRRGLPLRYALFEFCRHAPLLTDDLASELLSLDLEQVDSADSRDRWIVSQYTLLLAFPRLGSLEQADALLATGDDDILRRVLRVTKPLAGPDLERLMRRANEGGERDQYFVLALASHRKVEITKDAAHLISGLSRSGSERVRAQALRVIAETGAESLLSTIVKSQWKCDPEGRGESSEDWYGSLALLGAAGKGLLDHEDVVARISPRAYGVAATCLSREAVIQLAARVEASLIATLKVGDELEVPSIRIEASREVLDPPFFGTYEVPTDARRSSRIL